MRIIMFLFLGSMLFDYALKSVMGPERNTDPKAVLEQAASTLEGTKFTDSSIKVDD